MGKTLSFKPKKKMTSKVKKTKSKTTPSNSGSLKLWRKIKTYF